MNSNTDCNTNNEPNISSNENCEMNTENVSMEGESGGIKSNELHVENNVENQEVSLANYDVNNEAPMQASTINSQQTPQVFENTNMVPINVSINSYPPGTYMIGGQIVNNIPSNMMQATNQESNIYPDTQQASLNSMLVNPQLSNNAMYAHQQAQNNVMYINPQNSNNIMYANPQNPSQIMCVNPQNPNQVMYVNPQNPNQGMYVNPQPPQSMYYINPQNPNQVMLMTPQTSNNNLMYINPQNPNQVMYMNPQQNVNTVMYVNPQNPNQIMYMNPQTPQMNPQTPQMNPQTPQMNPQNPIMYIDPQNPNQIMYLTPPQNNMNYVNPQTVSNMYSQSIPQSVDSNSGQSYRAIVNQMLSQLEGSVATQEVTQSHVIPAQYSSPNPVEPTCTAPHIPTPVSTSSPNKRVKKVIYRNPNRAILPAEGTSQRNTESLLVPVEIQSTTPNKKLKSNTYPKHTSVKMLLAAKRKLVDIGPEVICTGCVSTFANDVNAFNRHICTGLKEKRCYCNYCFQMFITLRDYNGHICKTPDQKFNCNVCNSKFKSVDILHKHNFLHTRNNAFSCPVCSLIFQTPKILDNHMSCHKNEKLQENTTNVVERRVLFDPSMFPQSNVAGMSSPHLQEGSYVLDPSTYNMLIQSMPETTQMYNSPPVSNIPPVIENPPVSCETDMNASQVNTDSTVPEASTASQASEVSQVPENNTCNSAAVQAEATEALEAFEASLALEATCSKAEQSRTTVTEDSSNVKPVPKSDSNNTSEVLVNQNNEINTSESLMEIKMLTDNLKPDENVNKDSNQSCRKCKKTFSSGKDLSEHSCYNKTYTCKYCSKKFTGENSTVEFTKHVKDEHKSNNGATFSCAECFKKFNNLKTLRSHTKKHLIKNSIVCTMCNIEYSNDEELQEHNLSHRLGPGYFCIVCNAKFAFVRSMTRHMREIHTVPTGVSVEAASE